MPIEKKRVHHFATLAPPPSPIPTGKGSRSAADETFAQYLHKSFHIPDLTLPDQPRSHSATTNPDQSPCIVDFQSLASSDCDSIEGLVKSARDFGSFLVSGHGISHEELQSLLQEAEQILGIRAADVEINRKNSEARNSDNREEILRGHFRDRTIEWTTKLAEAEEFRGFSKYIEDIGCKLHHIAKKVVRVLSQGLADNEFPTEGWEATLSICRYARANRSELDTDVQIDQRHNYTLRVILPVEENSEIILRSETEKGPVRFHSDADTVVVTCGKELQERNHGGEGKCAQPLVPDFQQGTHLAIEYSCLLSTLHRGLRRSNHRKLSIVDQVQIVLILILILKLLGQVRSWLV